MKTEDFLSDLTLLISKIEQLGTKRFKKRIGNLFNNIESFSKHTIRVGLLGITSSGKSAVLNVLLGTGEKILKEQSKATTNIIVFCSKSMEPKLEIHFENNEAIIKTGKEITFEILKKYSSEDENDSNKYLVKYIKLFLPTFILDQDIEIADTPGLDAYGLKEHEDLTLREFLPHADLVIYLLPIRSPMKTADRITLDKVMESDQRILFVQTCIGYVDDQNYGDGNIVKKEELLANLKEQFKKDIQPYSRFKNAPIVQIETSLALEYFKTRDEMVWGESGFEELVKTISEITKQLKYELNRKQLKRMVDEVKTLNRFIKNTIKAEKEKAKSIIDLGNDIKRLSSFYEKIIQKRDETVSEWSRKLDAAYLYDNYLAELSKITDEKKFIRTADGIRDRITEIKTEFLDAIDHSKGEFKGYFEELGMDYKRTDIQNNITQSDFFFPNVQKKIRKKDIWKDKQRLPPRRPAFRESEEQSDYQRERRYEYYLDKENYYEDMKATLTHFFDPLLHHLNWWKDMISLSFIDPLRRKILALEDDESNLREGELVTGEQYNDLRDISKALDALINDALPLLSTDMPQKYPTAKSFTRKDIPDHIDSSEDSLFQKLYHRLKENMFQTYYSRCISAISDESRKYIILIGHDDKERVDFLRRLLRLDTTAANRLKNQETPFVLGSSENKDIKTIIIEAEILDNITFLLLSNNSSSLGFVETEKIFEKADVIQVFIEDLHRVGSALVDMIERNLFFELLTQHKHRLLLTYPKAAHFRKDRMHILFNEAIAEANRIFYPDVVRWFIYENFEIRYSYFCEIALAYSEDKFSANACLEKWKQFQIPFDALFNEYILKEQWQKLLR